MNKEQNREERLWDYIDGVSSREERTVIDKLLEADAGWKAEYEELLEAHQLMQSTELDAPSMRFSKNVMEEIAKLHIARAADSYINKNIIRGLVILFVLIFVSILIYGLGGMDWTLKDGFKIPTAEIPTLDYSKIFSNTWVNLFMMINVILGLFLFDRYMANKRKKIREQS